MGKCVYGLYCGFAQNDKRPYRDMGYNIQTHKSAYLIPGRSTYSVSKWAHIYMKEVVRLHGVPVSICLTETLASRLVFGRVPVNIRHSLGF